MGDVPNPGETFAGYTIVKRLGAGGMGEVYVARHPRLPRTDALKVLTAELSSDPKFRQRFDREADLMARLSHPNIVTIHDRGETDGHLWLTMEMVDGQDLQNRLLASPRGLPAAEVGRVARAVAAALDYASGVSLLHRDVKPANILVDQHGRVALVDFGIARLASDVGLTGTGMIIGTLRYASPEQLSGGQLDSRADQYSLAATVFVLLTGRPPFGSANAAQLIADHFGTPVPSVRAERPDLPNAVDWVLARAMAKNPGARFRTCTEFAEALSTALQTPAAEPTLAASPEPTMADPYAGPTQQLSRPVAAPKRRRGIAVAVVATLIVVAGGGFALWNWSKPTAESSHAESKADYSTEGASLPRKPAGHLLRSLATKPAGPLWTLPPGVWGPGRHLASAVGANNTHVVFLTGGSGDGPTRLLLVDSATGVPSWPAPVQVALDYRPTCGITASGSAIACTTRDGDNYRLVILNGATGAPVADIPFGNETPWLSVGAESIGVYVSRSDAAKPSQAQEIIVYRPDGAVAWSRRDLTWTKMYPDQGIITTQTGSAGPNAAKVLSFDTGSEVFSSPDEGSVSVNVYTDGFAVSSPRGGTAPVDFFDLAGAKTGAGNGWSAFSSIAKDEPASLPVLRNRDDMAADNPHFSIVNPTTGHPLWQVQQFKGEDMVPAGTHLVVGERTLLVYDMYTGRAGDAPLTVEDGIHRILGTDDSGMAFDVLGEIVVYDIATGAERWRLDNGRLPVAFGGGIYSFGSRLL